jgi:hypothetical protein
MDDDQRPGPLEPDGQGGPKASPGGSIMVGPILGVVIGYVVFHLLPGDTPLLLGLAIALVVIALTTYVTIEITRRRRRG